MNESNIYLKHKLMNTIVSGDIFKTEQGPIRFKGFSKNDFTDTKIIVETYHTLEQAISSDNFDILTDNTFTEEELHMIIRLVQHDSCGLEIADKIAKKCVNMLIHRKYINDKIKS